MNQSLSESITGVENNSNGKRPFVTSPVSDLPDSNNFVSMTMDKTMNLTLPSTSTKKKRQQKQPQQANSLAGISPRVKSQRNVPAFLHKLYNMVDDPSTDHLVTWSKSGNSFLVLGHEEFAKTILPRFYKHNTFSSFVRQLNMYDFHKLPQSMLQPNDIEIWEFNSPHFRKGNPELMVYMTRKRVRTNNHNTKQQDNKNQSTDANDVNLASLIKDISSIRDHQSTITSDLQKLHEDNEILWQEALSSREKHEAHQQVLQKILQFLTAVFSNDSKALADLSNEEVVQAQHISQGHEQAMLRNNPIQTKQHPLSESPDSSDSSDKTSYMTSSSSNNSTTPSSANNSSGCGSSGSGSSGSGSEDEVKWQRRVKNHHLATKEKYPSYSLKYSSNVDATPNTNRDKSVQSSVDVNKLDILLSSSFNPSIINNHRPVKHVSQNMISLQSNVTNYNRSVEKMPQNTVPLSVMENNNRSAHEITNEIDQLQVNVECLASQLGINPSQYTDRIFCDFDGFSENYSLMISSASRMDKFRLFALAGGSSPEQQPEVNMPSDYSFISDTVPYDPNNTVSNTIDNNYHFASAYFRQLLQTYENKLSKETMHHMPIKKEKTMGNQDSSTHNQSHQIQVNDIIFDPNAPNIVPDRSFSL